MSDYNDDFYKEFDTSPADVQEKFVADLDEDEGNRVVSGYEEYLNRNASNVKLDVKPVEILPTKSQAPAPEQSFTDKLGGAWDTAKEVGSGFLDAAANAVPGYGIAKSIYDFAGEPVSKGIHKGAKAVGEFAIQNPRLLTMGATGELTPGEEFLARSVGSSIVGDDFVDDMDKTRRTAGVKELDSTFGRRGTEVLTVGAGALGQIPSMLLPGGSAKKAADATKGVAGGTVKAWPRVKQAVMSALKSAGDDLALNAASGAAESAIAGTDMATGIAMSAGLPAVAGAAIGAGNELPGLGRKLGKGFFAKAPPKNAPAKAVATVPEEEVAPLVQDIIQSAFDEPYGGAYLAPGEDPKAFGRMADEADIVAGKRAEDARLDDEERLAALPKTNPRPGKARAAETIPTPPPVAPRSGEAKVTGDPWLSADKRLPEGSSPAQLYSTLHDDAKTVLAGTPGDKKFWDKDLPSNSDPDFMNVPVPFMRQRAQDVVAQQAAYSEVIKPAPRNFVEVPNDTPDFKPTLGVYAKDTQGRDVFRVVDVRHGEPNRMTVYPMDTKQQMAAVRKLVESNKILSFAELGRGPLQIDDVKWTHGYMGFGPGHVIERSFVEAQLIDGVWHNVPRDVPGQVVTDAPWPKPESVVQVAIGADNHVRIQRFSPEDRHAVTPDYNGDGNLGYARDSNGEPQTAKRIGKDPENTDNILVQFHKDGPIESIPSNGFDPIKKASDIVIVKPESVIEPRYATIKQVASPREIAEGREFLESGRALVRQNPDIFDKLFKFLRSDAQRGPAFIRDWAIAINALDAQKANRGNYLNYFRKEFAFVGKDADLKAGLHDVALGKMSWAELRAKHSGLAESLEAKIQPALERIDANEQYLLSKGVLTNTVRDVDGAKRYLARLYLRDFMPGWTKKVPSQLIDDATRSIVKRMEAAKEFVSPDVVHNEIAQILRADNAADVFFNSKLAKSKAFDRLRRRKLIPDEIRKLMGEVDDVGARIALTLADQEALVMRIKLFEGIAKDPELFSLGPQPHLDGAQIPNDRSQFGDLAGGYVHPQLRDLVVNGAGLQAQGGAWARAMQGFTRWRKGNMLASLGPIYKSTIGGMLSSVLSGGWDPLRPDKFTAKLYSGLQSMLAHAKDPLTTDGPAGLMKLQIDSGGDWGGNHAFELTKEGEALLGALSKMYKDGDGAISLSGFFESFGKLFQAGINAPGKTVGAALDFGDRLFRTASWQALNEKFLNNPAKYLPGVDPKDIPREAAKLASRRINDNFQNLAYQKKSIRKFSQNYGAVAPFIATGLDEFRIRASALETVLTDSDPELKWRMLQAGIILGAAWGVRTGYNHFTGEGVSEEGIEAAMANRKRYDQAYKPFVVISHRDDDGNYVMWDYTQLDPVLQLAQGNPNNNLASRVGVNLLMMSQGGGGREIVERMAAPLGFQPAVPGGQYSDANVGPMNFVQQGAKLGLAPRVIDTGANAYRQYQGEALYPGEEKLSLPDALLRGSNLTVPERVDPADPSNADRETGYAMRDLKGQAKSAHKYGKNVKAVEARIKQEQDHAEERGRKNQKYLDSLKGKK